MKLEKPTVLNALLELILKIVVYPLVQIALLVPPILVLGSLSVLSVRGENIHLSVVLRHVLNAMKEVSTTILDKVTVGCVITAFMLSQLVSVFVKNVKLERLLLNKEQLIVLSVLKANSKP
jgi:hypothetical protein